MKREWSRQLPGTPRPRQRGQRPQRPNDALRASPRHDHPDAPVRRRGHPRPLEHASAVPTDPRPPRLGERSTTRAQTRIRLPPAAPKVKSRAQSRIPVESHLRSSTEPPISSRQVMASPSTGRDGDGRLKRVRLADAVSALSTFSRLRRHLARCLVARALRGTRARRGFDYIHDSVSDSGGALAAQARARCQRPASRAGSRTSDYRRAARAFRRVGSLWRRRARPQFRSRRLARCRRAICRWNDVAAMGEIWMVRPRGGLAGASVKCGAGSP